MKRRNADCGKMRRPIKRNKITEGIYGSTLLYLKFLVLWALVILADFLLEFRFEFLWPFWLLLRSVHDSFKYQGLAFSVLFVCIALTSDLVCLFFIPVHWLFFAASTYVWIQYVWHTDKGICLPTIILWMLFVYLEAAVRWKDLRHLPLHLDLCRPFAAHCIGYPVVTLGFGFKSYVGYRMRQRRQRDVSKENEFYLQLLQQALPQEPESPVVESPQPPQPVKRPVEKSVENTKIIHNGHITSNGVRHHRKSMDKDRPNDRDRDRDTVERDRSTHAHIKSFDNTNIIKTDHHNVSSSTREHLSTRNDHNHTTKVDKSDNSTKSESNKSDTSAKYDPNRNDTYKHDKNSDHIHIKSDKSDKIDNHVRDTHNKTENHKMDQNHQNIKSDKELYKNNMNNMKENKCDNYIHTSRHETFAKEVHNLRQELAKQEMHMMRADRSDHQIKAEPKAEPLAGKGGKHVENAGNLQADTSDTMEKAPQQETEPVEKNVKAKNRGSSVPDRRKNKDKKEKERDKEREKDKDKDKEKEKEKEISQPDPAPCESCAKLEAEVRRLRSDLQTARQSENQAKIQDRSCKVELAQAQKENEELVSKVQVLTSTRQSDRQNLLNVERRVVEERRQRSTLETQLTNERKQRKTLEERAAKGECTEACRTRRQTLETENKNLRRELQAAEERASTMEQHVRSLEQQIRSQEAEARARAPQHGADVLMGALAAMQDKNSHLENSLSAETRIKLDLFSALGEANRKLEIRDTLIRSQEKELSELKSRLAQVLAVMPPDSFGPGPPCGGTTSKLRLADTPPLLPPQLGLSSPQLTMNGQLGLNGNMQMNMNGQLGLNGSMQQHGAGVVAGSGNGQANCPGSTLDPNATAYTPKNSIVGGEV